MLEISPGYYNQQSLEDFEKYYEPVARVVINKKTIAGWHKKLSALVQIVERYHAQDCEHQ